MKLVKSMKLVESMKFVGSMNFFERNVFPLTQPISLTRRTSLTRLISLTRPIALNQPIALTRPIFMTQPTLENISLTRRTENIALTQPTGKNSTDTNNGISGGKWKGARTRWHKTRTIIVRLFIKETETRWEEKALEKQEILLVRTIIERRFWFIRWKWLQTQAT